MRKRTKMAKYSSPIPLLPVESATKSALILIGTEIDKRGGARMALLARQDEEGLRFAGRRAPII